MKQKNTCNTKEKHWKFNSRKMVILYTVFSSWRNNHSISMILQQFSQISYCIFYIFKFPAIIQYRYPRRLYTAGNRCTSENSISCHALFPLLSYACHRKRTSESRIKLKSSLPYRQRPFRCLRCSEICGNRTHQNQAVQSKRPDV